MNNRLIALNITLLLFTILFASDLFAQEILSGLQYNPVIKQAFKDNDKGSPDINREIIYPGKITLPVFDDFHQEDIFPDTNIWLDNEVFINKDFPFRSANVGAATFDAINAKGDLYPEASSFPFLADRLTSRPIRLDSIFDPEPRAISPADSVYFSFYYQPQGRGNAPEEWDSLVLQFGYYTDDSTFFDIRYIDLPVSEYIGPGEFIYPLDTLFPPPGCNQNMYYVALDTLTYTDIISYPCDSLYYQETKWINVWGSDGMPLDTFFSVNGKYSRQVMVPITDTTFFRDDFQFRFYNIASLSSNIVPSWRSNTDHWNVDYVYLDVGRSGSDTTYRNITFAERAPTMLKRYQSMPYLQYKNDPTNEMADSVFLYITNLYDEAFNTDYAFQVNEVDGPYYYFYDGGGCNLPPFYSFGYQKCDSSCGASRACPQVNFIFPLNFGEDSAKFEVMHTISGFTAADTVGDTITLHQEFYNYYAYDDGTPEFGYGLSVPNGKVAYRFVLNTRDTLRAVRMYFNKTQNNANDQFFDLVVWRDNNGEPGEVIYMQPQVKPRFTNDLYRLATYYLDEPVPVNSVFYIGWIQSTGDNLNVGFDSYNDAGNRIYYNVTGQWVKTAYKGSLMMRPVVGKEFDPSGIEPSFVTDDKMAVFPNPNKDGILQVSLPEKYHSMSNYQGFTISLVNLYGQVVLKTPFKETLNIPDLAPGMYILRVDIPRYRKVLTTKLVIYH